MKTIAGLWIHADVLARYIQMFVQDALHIEEVLKKLNLLRGMSIRLSEYRI